MGIVQLTQIQRRVEESTLGYVDAEDIHRYPRKDRERIRRSRALAAFVVAKLANVTPEEAAATVTDGPEDDGVDAIAVLLEQPRMIIVQAKWPEDGRGSLGLDDAIKFREGVTELVQFNWAGFNEKIVARRDEIESILLMDKVRIDIVIAHTGSGSLAEDIRRRLDEYVEHENDVEETFRFTYLGQKELHRLLLEERQAAGVAITAELSDWGPIERAPRAVYGQVAATEVARWYAEHGDALLAKNVRVLLADSEVNEQIIATLTESPESFWYFNNGITVLCEEISKAPAYGGDRRVGQFGFKGASVVNGAQTVGSISKAAHRHNVDLSRAHVMVRFISLENAPGDFATDVTRATNTQNRIGGRDFVSLDPEQARLKDEFALEDLHYVFRSGERDPQPHEGCSVVEATIALACAQPDPGLSTQAKREMGRLWDAIDRAPYKLLFNPTTTYIRIWRAVKVMRSVDSTLRSVLSELEGRSRGVPVHGNRLVLHLVFARLPLGRIDDPRFDWDASLGDLEHLARDTTVRVIDIVEEKYPTGYLASLFKNAKKCADVASVVRVQAAS